MVMSYKNKYFQLGLFDHQTINNKQNKICRLPDQHQMFRDLAMYIYALDFEKEETDYIDLLKKYASGEIKVPSEKIDFFIWEYHQMKSNYLNHIYMGWNICLK